MPYKRYVKIGNKVYGPYEYHSYRTKNGSVKSKYVRKIDKVKKENIKLKKKTRFFEISSSLLFILVILFLILYLTSLQITGKIAFEMDKPFFVVNETLQGQLSLEFFEGEFYPADSVIQLNFNGQEKELTLKEFIELSEDDIDSREEDFYTTMNDELEGHGKGYGFIGYKNIPVDVSFQLYIMKKLPEIEEEPENITNITNVTEENVTEENITEPFETFGVEENVTEENITEENITEQPEKNITEENITEEIEENITEEPITEEPEQPKENKTEEPTEPTEPTEEPTEPTEPTEELTEEPIEEPVEECVTPDITDLTGATIEEVKIIDGTCTVEDSFTYNLEDDEFAQLVPCSVRSISENKTLDDAVIEVINKNGKVEVKTDYVKKEYGYGSDFRKNKKKITINLSLFEFTVPEPGTYFLDGEFIYKNLSLSSISTSVVFNNVTNITEENITEINITNFTITFVDRRGNVRDILEVEFDKTKEQSLNLKLAETSMMVSVVEKEEEITEELGGNFTKGITGSVVVQEKLPETELNIVELNHDITIQIDEPSPELRAKGIRTEIFALEPDKDIVLNESIITLKKTEDNISSVLYCSDWNIDKFSCKKNWTDTGIEFLDNNSHISFNITGFSAYAGGELVNITNITITNASLEIWDETDYETKHPGDGVSFYANYRDENGSAIMEDCKIIFETGETENMIFDDPFYKSVKVFDSTGRVDYSVICNVSEKTDVVEIEKAETEIVNRGPNWNEYLNDDDSYSRIFYPNQVNMLDSEGNYRPIDDVINIEKIKEHKFNVRWRDNDVNISIVGLGLRNLLTTKIYKKDRELRYDYKFRLNDSKFIPKVIIRANKELENTEYGFRLEDVEFDFSEKAQEDFDIKIVDEQTGQQAITGQAVKDKIKTKEAGVKLIKDFSKKVGDFIIIDPTIKLTSTNDSADIHASTGTIPPNHEIQMKWDIGSIPANVSIDDAKVCLYIVDKSGVIDNDANFSRVDDQTWTESIGTKAYDGQTLTNTTTSYTWSSTTNDTWSCIEVTPAVSTDYDSGNHNTSFRIEDPDAVVSSASSINDLAYMRYGLDSGLFAGNYFDFASREVLSESSEPYLNVTYSETQNPNIEFVSPTPDNGTAQQADYVYVNVTTSDNDEHSAYLDWNYTLKSYWKFDEGTGSSVGDNSTYSNTGTITNATWATSGKRGKALDYDGDRDYVLITQDNGALNIGNKTIMAWVKFNDLGTNQNIIRVTDADQANRRYAFVYINTNKLRFVEFTKFSVDSNAVITQTNTWYHVAVTYDGSTVKFYVDGNSAGSSLQSAGWQTTSPSYAYIGQHGGVGGVGGNWMNGTIDEMLIFNRILSQDEIRAFYDAGSYRLYNNFTSLSDGEYKFKAYAVDLSGNVNQTEERSLTIDSGVPSIDFVSPTPANNTKNKSTNNWAYINVTTSDDNDHYTLLDWNKTLVGWWRLENNADDDSTYGNDGTLSGPTYTSLGKFGGAYDFDGVDDYIEVSDDNSLDFGTDNFTVIVWVKVPFSGSMAWSGIVVKGYTTSAPAHTWGIARYSTTSNRVVYQDSTDDGGSWSVSLYSNVLSDGWHQIAVTRAGTNYTLYEDGSIKESKTANAVNLTNANALKLASGGNQANGGFNGTIDEVQIYDRALSLEEIEASYDAGSYRYENNFTELSGGSYNYYACAVDKSANKNCTETRILNINRKPSSVTLDQPTNETHTTNRSLFFNWTEASDGDNDTLQYVWNLTCEKSLGTCDPSDDRIQQNISEINYTLGDSEFLLNFWDTLEYYEWKVRVWDGLEFGDWSNPHYVYIDSLVAVSAINDTSDFGTMEPGTSNDTTDNEPFPISIQNDGNCFINMSIEATQLWNLNPDANESYRYKFDFLEQNSFDWANSQTSWANTPISSETGDVLAEFNWSFNDLNDSAELDILIAPYSYEGPGAKSSTINLTGEFTDVDESGGIAD